MAATSRKRTLPPDYKPSSPPSKGSAPGWVWVVIGLLISMVGALGYHLWDGSHHPAIGVSPVVSNSTVPLTNEPIKSPTKPSVGKESIAKEPAKEAIPKPAPVAEGTSSASFDFYKLLPAMKVGDLPESQEPPKPVVKELPKFPTKEPALKPPLPLKEAVREPTKEPPTVAGTIYILQAGAFHTPLEADRLRAHLAFIGLESTIQIVGTGTSEVWHRVRLGPFREFSQAAQIQQRLRQEGVSAILSREHHG